MSVDKLPCNFKTLRLAFFKVLLGWQSWGQTFAKSFIFVYIIGNENKRILYEQEEPLWASINKVCGL
jgi:hypothetical protein